MWNLSGAEGMNGACWRAVSPETSAPALLPLLAISNIVFVLYRLMVDAPFNGTWS